MNWNGMHGKKKKKLLKTKWWKVPGKKKANHLEDTANV